MRDKKIKQFIPMFCSEVRRIRMSNNMNQEEFAGLLYKDKNGYRRKQYISNLENGRRNLSLMEMERIAKILGCVCVVCLVPKAEISEEQVKGQTK